MDNRFRTRAYLEEYKMIAEVVRQNYDGQIEAYLSDDDDTTEFLPGEYIPMACTGLSAKKSYRGDKPEDLLIWEGDVLDCGDRIVKVVWNNQMGTWDCIFLKYVGEQSSNGITPAEWRYRAEIAGTIYD